jgi:RsiW-degrading membrane proteinase PrsW (M82 family)
LQLPSPHARPVKARAADRAGDLLPLGDWYRHHSLRSWPVLLFLALICIPSIALVIVGSTATPTTFDAGAWIFAAYFAIAWLLLLGVIIRPAHVTRLMLAIVTAIALATQVPLAVALETDLHATNTNLFSGIVTIGLPEELAKAIPVLAIALLYGRRGGLEPRDYLFVGAVSGLAFGASEVVRYFTVNGVAQFYQTVQSAIPNITALLNSGQSASASVFSALIGSVLYFILDFVWRFVTDPISHACWSGLTGYFIGLAATGRHRWYKVAWIGLVAAAVLHGLNDWTVVNGRATWILVTALSGILFLGYAKAGSGHELRPAQADAPSFLLPRAGRPGQHAAPGQPVVPGQDAEPSHAMPGAPVPREPAGSKRGRPWWEH